MNNQLQTPVAIIVFKRLDATKKMFEAVRQAQPQKLFIIADGWRNEAEEAKCEAVREYLESAVHWPCTVYKNYSDKNLGCKMRVVSGLNWVFSHVEEAIIIEDDCVLDQSFFSFCQELLEKYRNNPRIMQISGLNVQYKNKKFTTEGKSYYFSRFGEIWGWATWRRAWVLYDVNIEKWPRAKEKHILEQRIKDPSVVDYWEYLFDKIYEFRRDIKKFDAWAAQWVFAQLLHDGFSAVAKTNLIHNSGNDEDATRFRKNQPKEDYHIPIAPIKFPLTHPEKIEINEQADWFTLYTNFRIKRKVREKILFFLKKHMPAVHRTIKRIR